MTTEEATVFKLLRERAEQNWISVEDALPIKSMKVKWLCLDGVIDVGFYRKSDEIFWTFDIKSESKITHWQPLYPTK